VLLKDATAEQTGSGAHASFGAGAKPFFWIGNGGCLAGPVHIAFAAALHAEVDACHRAGLAAGGMDNGRRGFDRTTTPTPTARPFSIPMAAIFRLSVTSRSEGFRFCWT